MRKLVFVIVALLLILAGCSPYHNTDVSINLDETYAGVLTINGNITASAAEQPLEEVQTTIVGLINELDRYAGSVNSSIEDNTLSFVYTEEFANFDELEAIVLRLFEETINIEETVIDDIFKREIQITGLGFSATTFMDDIYDAIEARSLYGSDSTAPRTHHRGVSQPSITFKDVDYGSGEMISIIDYKKILSHDLIIKVDDFENATLVNTFKLEDTIELEAFETYYKDRVSQLTVDGITLETNLDKDNHSIEFVATGVTHDLVEHFQSEVFDQSVFYKFNAILDDNQKPTKTFKLRLGQTSYDFTLEERVLENSLQLDLGNYKISSVVDSMTGEQTPYNKDEFKYVFEDNVITKDDNSTLELIVVKHNPFAIVFTILKIVLGLLAVVAIAFGGLFGFKKYKEYAANRPVADTPTDSVNQESTNSDSADFVQVDQTNLSSGDGLSLKFNLPDFNRLKNKDMQIKVAQVAGIMLASLTLLTSIFTLIIQSQIAKLIGFIGMSDVGAGFGITKVFRVIGVYLLSGSIKVTEEGSFMGVGVESAQKFTVVFAIGVLIILLASYFISKKLLAKENKEERLFINLTAVVLFIAVSFVLTLIPIGFGASNELLGFGIKIKGSILSVLFRMLPIYLLGTYLIHTCKDGFSSHYLTLPKVVNEAIKKYFKVVLVISIVLGLLFLLQMPIAAMMTVNFAILGQMLISGVSLTAHLVDGKDTIGIMTPQESMGIVYVLFFAFLIYFLYDLDKKYKESGIENKMMFAGVYSGTYYIFGLLASLLFMLTGSGDGDSMMVMPNIFTFIIMLVISAALVFVRIEYLGQINLTQYTDPIVAKVKGLFVKKKVTEVSAPTEDSIASFEDEE